MPRGSLIAVAIHPDAVQTCAVASNRRVVLATVKVGTHDEEHARACELAGALSRAVWDTSDPEHEDSWSETLAGIASRMLLGAGQGAVLSFTMVLLDDGRARIWNCGGHRVLAISESRATQAAMDGFADTSNETFRTIVKEAAGPEVPVPTSVFHRADVNLADNRVLVISPHGQLLSLPGLAECTCVEDLARIVEREVPGLPHALVGISGFA